MPGPKIGSPPSAGSSSAGADGKVVASLPNWRRKLARDPANAKLVLLGDSTSYEPNDTGLYTRLRGYHAQPGQGLAGMTADTAHIISGGNNGLSLTGWLANSGGTYLYAQLVADAPDLVVASWGINDVRLLVDTYQAQTLTDLLTTLVTNIRRDLPDTDIVLRIPHPLLSENVGSSNFVKAADGTINPAGGAQQASDTLRNAYLALVDKWANVVVWDLPTQVFGRKSRALAETYLMSDQLHPIIAGYEAIADALVNNVIGRNVVDPIPATSTTFGKQHGDALFTSTRTPWTLDAAALDDTDRFRLVAAGDYASQGGASLVFKTNVLGYVGDIQKNDIVRLPDDVCFVITATPAAQNSGATGIRAVPNVSIGQTIPANTVTGGTVRVYRELDQGDALIGKLLASPSAFRYLRKGRITGGGTTFATIEAEPNVASNPKSGQWHLVPGDKLFIVGYSGNLAAGVPAGLALTPYAFNLSGAHLQLSGSGFDFTTYVGRECVVAGSHAPETTGDHQQTTSVAAGTVAAQATADVAVTFTGARFAKPFTAVIAQPQTALPAGVTMTAFVSAADTVTVRFANPTAAGVVVGTINVDLWLVR